MSNQDSPMLHRVKQSRTTGRLPVIPRKGRIRFFLLLTLGTLGITVIPRLHHPAPHVPKIKKSVQKPAQTEKTQQIKPPIEANVAKPEKRQKKAPRKKKQRRFFWQRSVPHTLAASIVLPKYATAPAKLSSAALGALLTSPKSSIQFDQTSFVLSDTNLTLYTSIDSTLQQFCTKLIKRYHPLYGALVAIDPVSGQIRALVSYTGDSVPDLGSNLYCRAFFPAASIFKTITAASAIEHAAYTAGCTVRHRGRSSTLYRSQLKKVLTNYNELSFSQAYARSVNAVFGRIGIFDLGKGTLERYATRFGFATDIPFELPCDQSVVGSADTLFELAELASGFNEQTTISPLHGALIAATIAEQGHMPAPSLIDSAVQTSSQKLLYRAAPHTWRIPIKAHTAQELRSMMSAVTRYGTAAKSFRYIRRTRAFNDYEYGGKTGSIDKDTTGRVDWFIGFARNPTKPAERLALGVVTVHGAYWTVHSSFIAAEALRTYLRAMQKSEETKPSIPETEQQASSTGDASSPNNKENEQHE